MDKHVYMNDFNKGVVYDNIGRITEELERERSKSPEERDEERERKLIYAQWMQGLKLSTMNTYRNFYY